jgi:hypothetical protein
LTNDKKHSTGAYKDKDTTQEEDADIEIYPKNNEGGKGTQEEDSDIEIYPKNNEGGKGTAS